MEEQIEPLVVGVRFSKVGKVYHFVADTITDIKVNDMVVVETSRGWQLGQVAQIIPNADPPPDGWKSIDRRATPRDLLLRQMWQMKEAEVVSSGQTRSTALNLVGIKIVSAEYSFDGSRLTIFFSSETEEKYDLKSMRSDMQKMFAPSQVEMRQIGPRDVAKSLCGMGACGLETRCCCLFLTEFSSISIRMAKEQGISLTPTEITGMCGRLRCCLIYEYDTYVDARSKLPKRNKRVRTPQGEGKVVDVVPLRGAVVVDLPEVGYREFPGSDVVIVDGEGQPIATEAGKGAAGGQAVPVGDEEEGEAETSTPAASTPSQPPQSNVSGLDQARSGQRPDRPGDQRQGNRQRPDRRGGDRASRQGSREQTTGQAPQTGSQPSQRGPYPGQPGRGGPQAGKPMRRDGQPQSGQSSRPGNNPPGGQPGATDQPKRGQPGSTTPQNNRDQRRRKGHHRDADNNED